MGSMADYYRQRYAEMLGTYPGRSGIYDTPTDVMTPGIPLSFWNFRTYDLPEVIPKPPDDEDDEEQEDDTESFAGQGSEREAEYATHERPFPFAWESDASGPTNSAYIPGVDFNPGIMDMVKSVGYGRGLQQAGLWGMLTDLGNPMNDPINRSIVDQIMEASGYGSGNASHFIDAVNSMYGATPGRGFLSNLANKFTLNREITPELVNATNAFRGLGMLSTLGSSMEPGLLEQFTRFNPSDKFAGSHYLQKGANSPLAMQGVYDYYQKNFGRNPTSLEVQDFIGPTYEDGRVALSGNRNQMAFSAPGASGLREKLMDQQYVTGKKSLAELLGPAFGQYLDMKSMNAPLGGWDTTLHTKDERGMGMTGLVGSEGFYERNISDQPGKSFGQTFNLPGGGWHNADGSVNVNRDCRSVKEASTDAQASRGVGVIGHDESDRPIYGKVTGSSKGITYADWKANKEAKKSSSNSGDGGGGGSNNGGGVSMGNEVGSATGGAF